MKVTMGKLELGAFSASLSVRDLDASCAFYEKLGFEVTGRGGGLPDYGEWYYDHRAFSRNV